MRIKMTITGIIMTKNRGTIDPIKSHLSLKVIFKDRSGLKDKIIVRIVECQCFLGEGVDEFRMWNLLALDLGFL